VLQKTQKSLIAETVPKKPVLIVLHQEMSTPGRVGHLLKAHGYELDARRPALGELLPETLAGHAGVVVFGGPMSANDDSDFIKRETEWIEVPLKEKKPYLGICLGAQMLARHIGGKVDFHPEGRAEVGYYPLRATAAGREVTPEWPEYIYQWHREGIELPRDATLLAEGDMFPVQAFRYGPAAFGVQFHAEVSHAMMCRWTTRGHSRMELPGAKPREEHFADRPIYDPAIRSWLGTFLERWLMLERVGS
jgi:GMP synthase (glutamine-hydrolysing)